jgi:hypothetical protein
MAWLKSKGVRESFANIAAFRAIHLYWLYTQGPPAIRDVVSAASLCGKFGLTLGEVTVFREDANCQRCEKLAKQQEKEKANAPIESSGTKRDEPSRYRR